LGGHTEALQVDFDPQQLSFEDVINLVWSSHNPIGVVRRSQYKSAIWYEDDQQKAIIESTMEPLVQRFDQQLTTEVLPLETFYNAEDYHQKYSLQHHKSVMDSFSRMYPQFCDFNDSTAAARLNGFAAGYGSQAMFESEKSLYGIDVEMLQQIART
jgi:peptide-methionine (S)-S-oxide reductase